MHCESCNTIKLCPNLANKTTAEILVITKKIKKDHNITSAMLSAKCGTPIGTIERIFSNNPPADIKWETLRPILVALTELVECKMLSTSIVQVDDEITKLREENSALKDRLLAADPQHKEEITKAKAEEHEKVVYLKEAINRKNKVIAILAALLFVAVAMIFIALAVDIMNPDRGFFWLGQFFKQNAVPHIGSIQ